MTQNITIETKSTRERAAPVAQGEHTPGPWTAQGIGGDPEGAVFHVTAPAQWNDKYTGVYVAYVPLKRAGYNNPTEAQKEANARLIAAAPDMLAALRIAHQHPERQHDAGEMPDDCVICAAIARATGREG